MDDWEREFALCQVLGETLVRAILNYKSGDRVSREIIISNLDALQVHEIIPNLEEHSDEVDERNIIPCK